MELWDVVHRPPDVNSIVCRYVFKAKTSADRVVFRHEARLITQGCTHAVRRRGLKVVEGLPINLVHASRSLDRSPPLLVKDSFSDTFGTSSWTSFQAGVEAHIANEATSKQAKRFARHLAQGPCDIDRVKTRIQSYLQGAGGDQDAWNPPEPLYIGKATLWRLCNALDFSQNVMNVDFVWEGLAAQQSTDPGYTAASALYSWAQETAQCPPLSSEEKGIFHTSPDQYFPDRRFLGASVAAARLKSLKVTGSFHFNDVLSQGLGISHTYCEEEADEDEWVAADREDWIAGACLQLLGSWRRYQVFILGQDDFKEARVKLPLPATTREYKGHEYSLYIIPPVDEEQRKVRAGTVQGILDALSRLHSTSNDVQKLVAYTQEHVRQGNPDLTSAELDSLCGQFLHNWDHQLDVVL